MDPAIIAGGPSPPLVFPGRTRERGINGDGVVSVENACVNLPPGSPYRQRATASSRVSRVGWMRADCAARPGRASQLAAGAQRASLRQPDLDTPLRAFALSGACRDAAWAVATQPACQAATTAEIASAMI
jgi:hypothetical protein